RATEGVDRLIVVTDREYRRLRPAEELEPTVLQRIGVLEFIDEDVIEPALVVLAQAIVSREKLEAAEQQLGKIDHAFAAARLLVQGVVLDLPSNEFVVRFDLVRPQARFLGVVDERLELTRRKSLGIDG